ncbi:MAG TPA: cation diffusion facilitator family transporter [Egibacteraceae bacterium]|nr:cation diffusion facilitator family transporter [Egibacteraceae bacterium]
MRALDQAATDPPGAGTPAQRRALRVALALNAGFLVVEFTGGLAFDSLALLADAGHMLGDVGGLALALLAFQLAARPASQRLSYGLQRSELLAALANAVALVAATAWIAVEAVQRIGDPPPVQGVGLLTVAAAGLAVNLGSAVLVARSRDGNLNVQGALLHLLADALGSVGAIVAGVAVAGFGLAMADPVVSLVIAALILLSVWGLLREAVHILLEGTPRDIDPAAVAAALHAEPAVNRIHHLHVWRLSSGSVALSAHVVADQVASLHEAQLLADRLKALLVRRFAIDHATLELECHDCRGQQLIAPGELLDRPPGR